MLAEGDCWTIASEAWEWLVASRYYARALDGNGELPPSRLAELVAALTPASESARKLDATIQ